MFGLSPLIGLAIYAAIAVTAAGSIYFAWQGFAGWVSAPRIEAQIKADAKEIAAAKAETVAAKTNQATAESNEGQCKAALGTSEKAKGEAEKQANRYREDNRRIIANYEKDKAATAPRVAELQAIARATANKAQTCEETLKKADDIVDSVLRKARNLPPKAK